MNRLRHLVLLLLLLPASALAQVGRPEVIPANHQDVSPPLRDLPPAARRFGPLEAEPVRQIPSHRVPLGPDQVVQATREAVTQLAPMTTRNFNGVGQGFVGPQGTFTVNSAPPDNNGAVGTTQFVEIVNTEFAVFDKTSGAVVYGPVPVNTLWSGFGGGCQTNNDGDPTVVFDHLANRWIISQFSVSTSPFLQCVAVSTSDNATGSYTRYSFSYSTQFPDYPKMAVWPDGYYTTYNMFNAAGTSFLGAKVCAFDRARMVAGLSATQVCFNTSTAYGGLLPADLDGTTPPPAGAPNYVVALGATSTTLATWKFHVDFVTPGNSTFTGPTAITVPTYTEACSGGRCIPQSGGGQLDSLADRLMYRAAYRNFGDHEALVVNHSVTAGAGVGVRWYELRGLAGITPALFQVSTYAPDSSYRWMGSMAMDGAGNIALGYSVSSSTIKPQIRFTGRLKDDALGAMTLGETTVIAGTGAQGSTLSRWGDYSSMSIDPVDDCTFWYTNQYLAANGTFNWRTRVASFTLCGATAPDFSLSASPSSLTIAQSSSATSTVSYTPTNGFNGAIELSVTAPQGMSASLLPTSISAGESSTLTVFVGDAPIPGPYTLTVTGTSGSLTHTTTVTVTVTSAPQPDFSLSASPSSLTLAQQGADGSSTVTVSPVNGFTGSVSLGISGLPTGATASFSPPATQTSSTLTVNAGSAAAGSYPLTVTGTSNGLTRTTTVTLTVTATVPPFTVSALPLMRTIAAGAGTTFAVTIVRTGSFTGAVSLSVSGLPSHVSGSFNPTPTSGTTSTLTVSSLKSARPGSYPLTITGSAGGAMSKMTVTLIVQ